MSIDNPMAVEGQHGTTYEQLEAELRALEHKVLVARLVCAKIATAVDKLADNSPAVGPLLMVISAMLGEIQAELEG